MNRLILEVSESTMDRVSRVARRQNRTVEDLAITALDLIAHEERLSEQLLRRGEHLSLDHIRAIMSRVGNEPPIPGDELPEGFDEAEIRRKLDKPNGR